MYTYIKKSCYRLYPLVEVSLVSSQARPFRSWVHHSETGVALQTLTFPWGRVRLREEWEGKVAEGEGGRWATTYLDLQFPDLLSLSSVLPLRSWRTVTLPFLCRIRRDMKKEDIWEVGFLSLSDCRP